MAAILLDTNVFLRLTKGETPAHNVARDAGDTLIKAGHDLVITPQVLMEMWAVATRPSKANGLGWTIEQTSAEILLMQNAYPMLPDRMEIVERWLELVTKCAIKGKHTHDARLAAVMDLYGVGHILTFNGADFAAFPNVKVAAGEVMPSD